MSHTLATRPAGHDEASTPAGSRSAFADILRGFALIGICIVNLPFIAMPPAMLLSFMQGWDAAAQFVTSALFEGKFFLLFSFVFGFGFAIQMARIARGAATPASFGRRLIGLGLLGVLHAVLLFPGDILLPYAILGALLWRVRDWPDDRLLALAKRLAGIAALGLALLALLLLALGAQDPAAARTDTQAALAAYGGSFADALGRRVEDWRLAGIIVLLFNAPLAFAAFCAGLVAGRRGLLDEPGRLIGLIRPHLAWLLPVALVCNLAAASFLWLPAWLGVPAMALMAVGAPALSALYVLALALAARRGAASGALAWLASAGRMSLSNYLGQSFVACVLFMGWGFGLYGELGRAALFGLALLIAVGLIALSRPWLSVFGSGPFEALLRRWTAAARPDQR